MTVGGICLRHFWSSSKQKPNSKVQFPVSPLLKKFLYDADCNGDTVDVIKMEVHFMRQEASTETCGIQHN